MGIENGNIREMDSATQDLLYQKIAESVYDEEKIVTCASIVHDFKIPLTDSKSLLTNFVNDYGNMQYKELHLTYMLSGNLKDGRLAVYLVKEEDLKEKRSLFESVSSEVIFSIQKSKNIDFNQIALADKNSLDLSDASHLGYIVGNNCIKRKIKKKLPLSPSPPNEINNVKEKKSFFQQFASNGGPLKTETQSNVKEVLQPQEKQIKGKQSGLMANFLKSAPKKNESTKVENIDNKFNEKLECNIKESITKVEVNGCNNDVARKKLVEEEMDVEEFPSQPDTKKLSNSQAKATSKKRKKENKNVTTNKKRKRIQEFCDSDSDDIFVNDEKDEDIIEKSDEEPEVVSLIKPALLPKNKKRKAIDKTYMDEDGFMVTTTEYVYESVSEDEEKLPEKPVISEKPKILEKKSSTDSENEVKNSRTKNKKNSKKAASGSQPTLLNFFKKN